jgi:hypothetical protein
MQSELAAMLSSRPAYCTQQTGGPRRGGYIASNTGIGCRSAWQNAAQCAPTPPHNIACNTLPCSFTRLGLLTPVGRFRAVAPSSSVDCGPANCGRCWREWGFSRHRPGCRWRHERNFQPSSLTWRRAAAPAVGNDVQGTGRRRYATACAASGAVGACDHPAAWRDTMGSGSVDPDQCAPGLVCGSCNRTARRGARLPQTSVPAVTVAGTFLPTGAAASSSAPPCPGWASRRP